MRFSVVAAVASVLSVASAANIEVLVGANQTLTYTPPSITANIGDTVTFVFTSKNHTVSQSSFTDPCALTTNGISSGFQFVAANATSVPSWSFTVNNVSAPLWFFCEQTNPVSHCSKGMVFAVNPTAAKTFAQFQATAMGGSSSAAVSGGAAAGTSAAGSGTAAGAAASTTPSAGYVNRVSAAGVVAIAAGLLAGLVL